MDNPVTCAICGKNPATTSDHIPPRSMFPRPRPSDLITIPTCPKCNKATEKLDEEFRVFINLFVGETTPEAENLWKTETLSTVQHNKKLLRKALLSFRPAYLTSTHGIITEKSEVVIWDESPNKVVEKIIRGLYYHHFSEILADRVNIIINQINIVPPETVEGVKSWPCNFVGGGQFLYRYARANDEPLYSAWLLVFHRKLVVLGRTEPVLDSNNSI